MGKSSFFQETEAILRTRRLSKAEFSNLKIALCQKHGLKQIPSDFELLLNSSDKDLTHLKQIQSKPGRTGSGVAVVAIMTKPSDCPHGKCTYCPGGKNSFFGDTPQSYTGKEPATLRGIRNNYDPYLQVFNRLEQYTILGHSYDKVELIIMGGTFISQPKSYRDSFIGYSLKAMNDFSAMFYPDNELDLPSFKRFFGLPGEVGNKNRTERIKENLLRQKGKTDLGKDQLRNEKARIRCVAMCIETRPDYCLKPHIDKMLRLGTTRVEMGVQSLNNTVLKKVERGHTVEDTILATRLLKDSFLKVGYHMMPGLPGTSEQEDINMLKQLFSNPDFRPDALKIYPCMVIPGTKLYSDFKNGSYLPLSTESAAELIAKFKPHVPTYCRIMRVQRDIPSYVAKAGVDKTNLRQYVDKIMEKEHLSCSCIRCREPKARTIELNDIKINRLEYESSGGTEVFISADDSKNNILAGFCRLRIPSEPFRKEIISGSAGIRELHVYGEMANLGDKGAVQHRGIGKRLLREAEKLSREKFGKTSMVIISGIGVREYYRKLGYTKKGPYMVKRL
jgi:elongator complex protein 3